MRARDILAEFHVSGLKILKRAGFRAGGSKVGQALQLLLWIGIVSQLLWGVQLVGEGAEFWKEAFQKDYEREVCGRYQAFAANLKDAVTTWRKMGCAVEDDEGLVEAEVESVLVDWRERYGEVELERCEGIRLHREGNAALDEDYPNWVVRYE